MKKLSIAFILGLLVVLFLLFIAPTYFFRPTTTNIQTIAVPNTAIETVTTNLAIPWEIAFLPDGDMLVTERDGKLLRIRNTQNIIEITGVTHRGEGGLLGMALHPEFPNTHWIYLYFTSDLGGTIHNRVERFILDLERNQLTDKQIILDTIPGAAYHDGGRIAFGPDGYLYIATGDAGNEDNAQDLDSLAGKILRVDDQGNIPSDNPFGNEVYSYGHRNMQGLAWDEQGRLWATEHGRSGALSGYDELNMIEKGKNYGWPEIQGDEQQATMETPVIHSGPSETWAPAGAVYADGKIFFTGLRGVSLYVHDISTKTLTSYLKNEFGRLRAITLHDDALYISTSNRDGRGNPVADDDRILKIPLSFFSS